MALWSRQQTARDSEPEITDSPNISYRSFTSTSQHCPTYLPHLNESSLSQPNVSLACSSANTTSGNVLDEFKPALPPKPASGPPIYREPPCPPVIEDSAGSSQQSLPHPDICINSAPSNRRTERSSHSVCPVPPCERPEGIGSRTQAWVQEHKSSGKLVGEKLSSLQRKLRSLLSQTPHSKDIVENEKGPALANDPRIIRPSSELSQRPKSSGNVFRMNHPSTSEQRLSYISTSSIGSSAAASSYPISHGQRCNTFQQLEKHPFGAPLNTSEQEDTTDPVQLRDTCNKFFTREQRSTWSNYLSPRNCYSNNIKSTYDYDKLAPKEVIGRPSQEKKAEASATCHAVYEGVTPFPSFENSAEMPKKQSEHIPQPPAQDTTCTGTYYARRTQNFNEESNLPDISAKETAKTQAKDHTCVTSPCDTITDCADASDLYKSSSESGRGTMHGSKGLVSPHSSGVSATSNLDTSLDSDHSTGGTIWNQQNHCSLAQDNACSEDCKNKQLQHVYETPNAPSTCRQVEKQEVAFPDDATSESLSVTPPLPPISPAPSPPISVDNSPKLSSKAKYKLSLSASALNSCYMKSEQQKCLEGSKSNSGLAISSTKSTPGKKSGVRRNTSITQQACKHWNGKNKNQSSSRVPTGTSMHRLGIVHGNCSTKKSSSPSRIHMAFPCYPDIDPELTSTTTGLDMESLLDEAEDYSSDLSATASTMDPNEVSMIRKQLEGLETMYSEILRLLGVKNNTCKGSSCSGGNQMDLTRYSRRRLNGSLSSLTGRSSLSRGNHSFADKRGFSEKRRMKDTRTSPASKRLQRLESHVVTLARSVAHLSSEMRTQHVLVQELENMRRDVTWVQERLRLMQLAQGCHSSNTAVKSQPISLPRDWDNFRQEVLELLNPCRAKKLTKFFGDEPPLIRQFLKRLGYEKYATNFEAEKIGIKELPYLTEERLQKMGLPMGPRIRILQEANACCQQNQYKVYIV